MRGGHSGQEGEAQGLGPGPGKVYGTELDKNGTYMGKKGVEWNTTATGMEQEYNNWNGTNINEMNKNGTRKEKTWNKNAHFC